MSNEMTIKLDMFSMSSQKQNKTRPEEAENSFYELNRMTVCNCMKISLEFLQPRYILFGMKEKGVNDINFHVSLLWLFEKRNPLLLLMLLLIGKKFKAFTS